MDESKTWKERRRRRTVNKMDDEKMKHSIQKEIANVERELESQPSPSYEKLFRRDTYVLVESAAEANTSFAECESEESSAFGGNDVDNYAEDYTPLTYSVSQDVNADQNTYSIEKSADKDQKEKYPVPAPRRKKPIPRAEKVSSDTDKDVTEIDLDEIREKSDISTGSRAEEGKPKAFPVPKPRKLAPISQILQVPSLEMTDLATRLIKSKSATEIRGKSIPETRDERCVKSETDPKVRSKASLNFRDELPLANNLKVNLVLKSERKEESTGEKRLLNMNTNEGKEAKEKKKSKIFSFATKSEKRKTPKIVAILKDLQDVQTRGRTKAEEEEEEENSTGFPIDSPSYLESVQNDQIYVQNKNGFYITKREGVMDSTWKRGNQNKEETHGEMEGSTVKTAIFLQKSWSRLMMCLHGLLAGFAFSHAATVTAIMLYYSYDPEPFIRIYSCLSLKIHFAFYALTTFSIISCFDRIDIGHFNRKHMEIAWKTSSMWGVLCVYVISYALTFSNQKTEARFDAYQYVPSNETSAKIWNTQIPNDVQISLLTWFHTIWARDVLLLIAWLIISLTKFTDYLTLHLSNMIKYAKMKPDTQHY